MKVYLDNNVLIDIESGKYQLSDFLSIAKVDYYYSDAHLEELLEAKGNPKISHEGRLTLISKICGQKCILTGGYKEPEFIEKDVVEMYRIVDTPIRKYIGATAQKGANTFDKIRKELGFDSYRFNNEDPKNVLVVIDDRMRVKLGMGLSEYLIRTEAFGGKALYNTLLNMIDTANYWGDSKTHHSEIARLYDASHAYLASVCDVLVTGDKKMRAKIKAIYSFLQIDTKVMSAKDFLKQ